MDSPHAMGTQYLNIIFGLFLTKIKRDQACKIMSMSMFKFGPTASNFGFDFRAENERL